MFRCKLIGDTTGFELSHKDGNGDEDKTSFLSEIHRNKRYIILPILMPVYQVNQLLMSYIPLLYSISSSCLYFYVYIILLCLKLNVTRCPVSPVFVIPVDIDRRKALLYTIVKIALDPSTINLSCSLPSRHRSSPLRIKVPDGHDCNTIPE